MASQENNPKNLLFKWIGGKKWLSKTLKSEIEKINFAGKEVYIEPFIGGMGAFFAIFDTLKTQGFKRFILNDINEIIILTYNLVKNNPQKVAALIEGLEVAYEDSIMDKSVHKLNKTKEKEKVKELLGGAELYFRNIKKNFNTLKKKENRTHEENLEIVSLFLFLQDHSFNGVYRENNGGEYNTPFNWDPKLYNIQNKQNTIMEYSKFFEENHIEFMNLDVFALLKKFSAHKNDSFLYLDPPYLNAEEKSENQYNKEHFGYKQQEQLLALLENFDSFMYSNHFLPIFENYFTKTDHRYLTFGRKNIMTAKKENRGNDVPEILGVKETVYEN